MKFTLKIGKWLNRKKNQFSDLSEFYFSSYGHFSVIFLTSSPQFSMITRKMNIKIFFYYFSHFRPKRLDTSEKYEIINQTKLEQKKFYAPNLLHLFLIRYGREILEQINFVLKFVAIFFMKGDRIGNHKNKTRRLVDSKETSLPQLLTRWLWNNRAFRLVVRPSFVFSSSNFD